MNHPWFHFIVEIVFLPEDIGLLCKERDRGGLDWDGWE